MTKTQDHRHRYQQHPPTTTDGEWVVAWRDCSPRVEANPIRKGRRYADRSDAETEIDAWYAAVLRVRGWRPGISEHPLLARLDDGELVLIEEEA
jgi:hypothetical protein